MCAGSSAVADRAGAGIDLLTRVHARRAGTDFLFPAVGSLILIHAKNLDFVLFFGLICVLYSNLAKNATIF